MGILCPFKALGNLIKFYYFLWEISQILIVKSLPAVKKFPSKTITSQIVSICTLQTESAPVLKSTT